MKKISEFSKKVDTALRIINRILVTAASIAVIVCGVFALIPNLSEVSEGSLVLTLGNLNLTLSEELSKSNTPIRTELLVTMISVAALTCLVCYGIKILRAILAPMKEEHPFDNSVSVNMKKLGILLCISSVIIGVVDSFVSHLIYRVYDVESLLLSDKIVNVTANYSIIDVEILLLGVFVFLLSHVFKYGTELQQQADETL